MFELITEKSIPADLVKETLLKYLNTLVSNQKITTKVLRLAIPVEMDDLLPWLHHQPFDQKIYWYDARANLEVAGVGEADIITSSEIDTYSDVIQRVRKYSGDKCSKCRYFGGFSFYKETPSNDEWQSFGAYYFILPKFEIIKSIEGTFFNCTVIQPDEYSLIQLAREIEKIDFSDKKIPHVKPVIADIMYTPDRDGWYTMIRTALQNMRDTEYDKIVLARKLGMKFRSKINPISVLSKLKKNNHQTVSFCIQPQKDNIFIGATPELLYRRDERKIISEAVAGTRPRGKNAKEDELFSRELLESEKELREHLYVSRSLQRNLADLCNELTSSSEVSILKLAQVQHLFVPFNGVLKSSISDGDILEAIHPTPAVGGYPEKSILPIIRQMEPFNRGWYAAPVGWTAADSATFAVAIRSALFNSGKMHLYSGAGIVEGSSPEKEWEELDNKVSHYYKFLGVDEKPAKKHQQLLELSAN